MNSGQPSLSVRSERWPIAGRFTISRGAKTEAEVVVASIAQGGHVGRGECVPYARYGETLDGVAGAIAALAPDIARGLDRAGVQQLLPPGAARNALDCALWDLEARQSGRPAYALAGLSAPQPAITAYTLSLDTADAMAEAAARVRHRRLIKVKLGAAGDPERIAAIRKAAPSSALIVDANEGWSPANLASNLDACASAGVILVEQPLPDGQDGMLASFPHPVPICADESAHASASLPALLGRYDAVNIKLDKTGGLTEALATAEHARQLGLRIMVGCMVATSLSMAPALLLAQMADFVDLDGALLLERDRSGGLRYERDTVHPATPDLWG